MNINSYYTYDPEYIELKRLESRTRYESTLEGIFERYGRDMTEESDEVDLRTGEVIVNRGHLNNLQVSWFLEEETLSFSDDNLENDFFENILSLVSINQRETIKRKKHKENMFPQRFPSKEKIFKQFGSLGPSIIKLIESQKRKRKHFKKIKRVKYPERNSKELNDLKIRKISTFIPYTNSDSDSHSNSCDTAFKFQRIPVNISNNQKKSMTMHLNDFFIHNNKNTIFNSVHAVRRFDIIIDCPKSNHTFIQNPKIGTLIPKNTLETRKASIYSSHAHLFDQYYNFLTNSQTKPNRLLNHLSLYNNLYPIESLSSESASQAETKSYSTNTSIEETNLEVENAHKKKIHCNKLFCFTCSCL
ncbi:hypothetical protein PNEG_00442 [Pneumocystis murina B123]|uniref:Uncharacterized protein n=1 Tax=Pneumocystis murina (strain B123) TaxID=1069680 RepID=M7PLT1_PNEMU|nr:hypothetical protein PNEG_00442 [Pneumocystis murina B123]EMR11419.1 hypothetical protein PNEG_00442 [Pneumocystis murina B123]